MANKAATFYAVKEGILSKQLWSLFAVSRQSP
jgi:hypothetical protein